MGSSGAKVCALCGVQQAVAEQFWGSQSQNRLLEGPWHGVSPFAAVVHASQHGCRLPHKRPVKPLPAAGAFWAGFPTIDNLLFSIGKVNSLWRHGVIRAALGSCSDSQVQVSQKKCSTDPALLQQHRNKGISWERCQKTGVPSFLSKPG